MSTSRRPLLSPRALLHELLFLVRMRASARRFRHHDMAWRRHRAAENRHLDAMTAEVDLRAALTERRIIRKVGKPRLRTEGARPAAAPSVTE